MAKRRILHKIKLEEISGVDRPCQEGARMTIMKRADDDVTLLQERVAVLKSKVNALTKRNFSAQQRQRAADTGAAMPDGSFPIQNVSDLHNAIRAIGRAKNPDAVRRHIRSRAKALNAESALPDG